MQSVARLTWWRLCESIHRRKWMKPWIVSARLREWRIPNPQLYLPLALTGADVKDADPGDLRRYPRRPLVGVGVVVWRQQQFLLPGEQLLVGLDVIGDCLTEVNVTSPTCFQEITQQTGFDVPAMFLDALEAALQISSRLMR